MKVMKFSGLLCLAVALAWAPIQPAHAQMLFAARVVCDSGNGPRHVSPGDFNGDGYPDIAVANVDGDDVSILLGNGDGTFRPAVHYDVGNYPQSVALGDFNEDGRHDLDIANKFS